LTEFAWTSTKSVNTLSPRPVALANDGMAPVTLFLRSTAERLLLWSVVVQGKPLSSLTHEDCLRYQQFLADPQPP